MKQKTITAIIEASKDGFGVYSNDLPGITGFGESVDDAKKDFLEALSETIKTYNESRQQLPKELNNGNIKLNYKYDVTSIFDYFELNASLFAERINLNPSLLRQYKGKQARPSEKQKKKIQDGLHQLGKELLAVRL